MQLKTSSLVTAVAVALGNMGSVGIASAQERIFQLPRIDVVGQTDAERERIPAAINVITREDIERIQPRSTEDLLRTVPGVYIKREEDSAVVTNFGVRGLPAGDFKTLVLEDGVPVQPGIFVGNGRYYNPRVQRMEGVEVLKGASSLRYGPNYIGGVINFQTRTPEDGVTVSGKVGSWNTRELVAELGGSSPNGDSRFGIIATHVDSDGWMDKGYTMTDVMVKAGTAVGDNQFVGAKFVYYDNEAQISYRGLFPDAYEAGATFNPGPDDRYFTNRISFDINHDWEINNNASLKTLVYWSKMNRNYWRADPVPGVPVIQNGLSVWDFSSNTFRGANREFERLGAETRLSLNHQALGINNEAQLGLRMFQEELTDIDRRDVPFANRYDNETYEGRLARNRLDSADNIAVFVENRFDVNPQLSITGGLRAEYYETKRVDRRKPTEPAETFSDSQVLPGVGATYRLNPMVQLYGSIYRAMAPPSVGNSLSGSAVTDAEKSTNIEIGVRGSNGPMRYQVAFFNMDFSNYVEPGITALTDPTEGKALVRGIEGALGYDFGNGFTLDSNLSYVPTAEVRGERVSGESGLNIRPGNRLAYSPEWLATLTLGYQSGPLATALQVNYTGEVFGNADNSRDFVQSGNWSGLIPSYTTVDLTGQYDVSRQLRLFGAIKNLTDERYISGLRQGIYVGPERSFELGARYSF